MGYSDRWLINRTLAGDRAAFGQIYDRHISCVFPLLRRLTGDAAEAEDITQETFVAAYQALASWRGEGAFSTWLCGIAVRLYAGSRRRRVTTELLEDTVTDSALEADPFARMALREDAEAMEAAIADLPDLCREAFVLIRLEGMSYKQAAALLEVPLGTIQSRLWRATRLLQTELAPLLQNADAPLAGAAPSEKGTNHAMR